MYRLYLCLFFIYIFLCLTCKYISLKYIYTYCIQYIYIYTHVDNSIIGNITYYGNSNTDTNLFISANTLAYPFLFTSTRDYSMHATPCFEHTYHLQFSDHSKCSIKRDAEELPWHVRAGLLSANRVSRSRSEF